MFLQTNREVSKFMPTVRSALPQLNLSNSRKLQTPLFLLSWYFLSLVNLSGVQCFSSVLWIYSLGEMPYLETSTHIAYKYIFLMVCMVRASRFDKGSPYFCLKLNMHFSKCVLYFLEAVFWLPWGNRIFLIKGG